MISDYEPELGQALFGQPCQELECPDYIESHLEFIRQELERVKFMLMVGVTLFVIIKNVFIQIGKTAKKME